MTNIADLKNANCLHGEFAARQIQSSSSEHSEIWFASSTKVQASISAKRRVFISKNSSVFFKLTME